jgi:hypothetical protein
MVPKTRSIGPITPSKTKSDQAVYTTRCRIRFFDTWDSREPGTSLRSFCDVYEPDLATASQWLRQREALGSSIYHRIRKLSNKLRRRPIVSEEQCKILVSPLRNPIRRQAYEA